MQRGLGGFPHERLHQDGSREQGPGTRDQGPGSGEVGSGKWEVGKQSCIPDSYANHRNYNITVT